jgi:hypothetical protein
MSLSAPPRERPAWAWLLGLVFGLALCSNYFLMFGFRTIWQSHYPKLAEQWTNNGPFTVVGMYGTEGCFDELVYATRVKEASTHLRAFDPFIRENHSKQYLVMEVLTFSVLGAIQAMVRDISWTWIVARFLCCVLWVVLLYHLTLRMDCSPHFASFCAVFVGGFSYILTFLFVCNLSWHGSLFHILAHNAWTLFSYGRTESIYRLPRPGLINIFSYLVALACIKTAESRGWRWAVLSGVLVGALAYVRVDVWSTHIFAIYIFAATYALKRQPCGKLFASAALASILSLPYLYLTYPPSAEWMMRIGMFQRRQFHPESLSYLLAFLAGVYFGRRPLVLFLSAVAAAAFLAMNIELVTGTCGSMHSWIFLTDIYIFLLAVSALPQKIKNMQRPWLAACAVVLMAVFLQGVVYAGVHFPFSGLPRDYADAFQWLRCNTPRDSVVFTLNPEIDWSIPAFTDNKVFLTCPISDISDFPLERNTERLLAGLDLLGADKARYLGSTGLFASIPPGSEVVDSRINDRRQTLADGLVRSEMDKNNIYYMVFFLTPARIAREILAQAAGHTTADRPDYVWVGYLEKDFGAKFPPKKGERWKEVYRNASVTLYQREGLASR